MDGGMAANDWFCQFLADMLQMPVERPAVLETTALGAAFLAGLAVGIYDKPADVAAQWQCERRFEPGMAEDTRAQLVAGWKIAVARALT